MYMEIRNSKTEMPLFKVKGEKFIFAVQMKLQGKCGVVGENRMEKIKLTDICNPKQWKTIPTSELLENGYPVYGANGIIGYYSEFNHKNPVITVTCRGATCGTINITVPKSYVTGNAMCLDDMRSDIYMEYLYYCLKHYNFNNVISGSAQPQITRQGMEKIYVTIGSHNEQMDIVDKLKKVENVIGLRKRELKQLDTLVKSRFVELFGDPVINSRGWKKALIGDDCFVTKLAGFEYTQYINYEEFYEEYRLIRLRSIGYPILAVVYLFAMSAMILYIIYMFTGFNIFSLFV